MPYIKEDIRKVIDEGIKVPTTAGELNYKITKILMRYMSSKGIKYQTFNDIMGALEGAKLEIYRRVIAPYEDTKAEQNGDVY